MHNPLASRPPVVIQPRPAPTKAQKAGAWTRENGLCYLCGKPVPPDGMGVQWDHRDARAVSGDDTELNLYPTHPACHGEKTAKHDAPRIAKVKRQAKLTAPKIKNPRGFRAWRKFDGTVVRRDE